MKTCYVSTPFGKKPDSDGRIIDFDPLYFEVIKPVLTEIGFRTMRGDELTGSAFIHKATLAAVMNSDAMVADLTGANPNVLYEVGMRHAVNPGPTILMYTRGTRLPYNLTPLFVLPYRRGSGEVLSPDEAQELKGSLKRVLSNADEQDKYRSPLHDLFPELHVVRPREPCVFIGHGRSKLWARIQTFLQDLNLKSVNYESQPRAGLSIERILKEMLRQATFAILVLTAEDETAEGGRRARQNVVHEAGLFQGMLGFERAVMLVQKGLEEFSNVAGLQYISFEDEKIEDTFWNLEKTLEREGLLRRRG
jgi:hypothetical protein